MQVSVQENLKKVSKMHLNSKVGLAPKSAIWYFWSVDRHFWSAERHFQSAEWHTLRLWPNSIRVTIKHILFDFLAIKMRPNSYSSKLFFSSLPASVNRDWISKFSILFHALRFLIFLTPRSSIFSLTLKRFWRL